MFGSMHCSPMGRPLNVVKIYGAVVLCQAPCIVPLWVELGEAFGLSCNLLFGVTCWGNLEKRSLQAFCLIWAALPGAQHLERCFAFKSVFHMTRRAFLALRVIPLQGKFGFLLGFKRMYIEASKK